MELTEDQLRKVMCESLEGFERKIDQLRQHVTRIEMRIQQQQESKEFDIRYNWGLSGFALAIGIISIGISIDERVLVWVGGGLLMLGLIIMWSTNYQESRARLQKTKELLNNSL